MWFLAFVLAAVGGSGLANASSAQSQKPVAPDAAEPLVRWKGTSYAGKDIAAAIGDKAALAVVPWSLWAQAHGYVLELDPELRRLFVHAEKRGVSAEVTILTRALEAVDKLAQPAANKTPELLVILELEGPKDFGLLLDDLAQRFAYLAPWAQSEKQQLGFVLEQPLAAAFLASAPDVKEWNPKNELANRTAQIALFERFGRLPNWLMQGLSWNVEMSVCGSIYCFPFRSGFVARKEHKSWTEQLKALFAAPALGSKPRQLTIDDLAGWKRSTYVNDRALLAWGAASFLAKRHAVALPLILEDLHAIREQDSKLTKPDGSWKLNPDYEVPAEKQLEILKLRASDDFIDALQRFCAGN